MTNGTILIIEDNKEFRTIYGDRLNADGFDVVEADDGEAGLARMRTQPVSLVITDLNMPKLDGFGVIEQMKQDEQLRSIPILVMSVFDTPEHFKRARELGADGYLVKGMQTPNEVSAKVSSLVA